MTKLLATYLKKTALHPVFDEEEVAHWFITKENIVNCYVVEVERRSLFCLPPSV